MNVIWLKRDLRIRDHRPLVEAATGPCLVLYVYEPEVYAAAEFDTSHLVFINQTLREFDRTLRRRGGRITFRVGHMPDVLDQLHRQRPITALFSHEETGNQVTYQRDRRVAAWCRAHAIPWRQFPQNGVIRGLRNRDGWAARWQLRMQEPLSPAPRRVECIRTINPEKQRHANDLDLPPNTKSTTQLGGEQAGRAALDSFLAGRGVNYRHEMSSPVTAADSCSRLSPYLAYGCLSLREVHQAVANRVTTLKAARADGDPVDRRWFGSLSSFGGRLRWHCHFMQKLEDEPRIEFENLSRAYDGLREDAFNEDYFDAWCCGQTGYPLVDACMRALHAGGWINFRMRAMLVSFASYHLWLHWRRPAVFLAKHFLDFEPGIHFSQVQMQSGVTGINTVRIYSPIKQVRDQDPGGVFIKRYVPELAAVPTEHLAEPHKMPPTLQHELGCVIGRDYPAPIVDHATAYKRARDRIWQVRKQAAAKQEARRIYTKHGSRRRPQRRPSDRSAKPAS